MSYHPSLNTEQAQIIEQTGGGTANYKVPLKISLSKAKKQSREEVVEKELASTGEISPSFLCSRPEEDDTQR